MSPSTYARLVNEVPIVRASLLMLMVVLMVAPAPSAPQTYPIVRIAADDPGRPISPHLFGSNMYLRIEPTILQDPILQQRTAAIGTSFYRLPGGSLSNSYNWLACELRDPIACPPPALRPTDFIIFLRSLDVEVMWTISANATPQENDYPCCRGA